PDALAALPQPSRPRRDRAALVARLLRRERALRGERARGRAAERAALDPRLPAALRPCPASPRGRGPADRLLPAHPVPRGRAVRAAALARPPDRRAARRRRRRLPDGGVPAELRADLHAAEGRPHGRRTAAAAPGRACRPDR